MNSDWKRWPWRGVKLALAILVLVFVGMRFHRDLIDLDLAEIELRPAWLLASAGLYLLGLYPSAWFWRHLHGLFGYPVSHYAAVRAHFVGQLGKYVPGKAMAVLIRAHLVHPCGIPYGVSVIVSFYEVFTGMAAGAILSAVIFLLEPPEQVVDSQMHPALFGLGLIAVCGIPLLPGVFNFVIARLTARIQAIQLYSLPPVRLKTLVIGLLATGAGWWLQGLSVLAMLQAVMPTPRDWSMAGWAQCTAGLALANVAGFVVFFLPAGLGVREELLRMLLGNAGPVRYIAVAVILLRLDWIVAEVAFAAITYWRKPSGERGQPLGSDLPS